MRYLPYGKAKKQTKLSNNLQKIFKFMDNPKTIFIFGLLKILAMITYHVIYAIAFIIIESMKIILYIVGAFVIISYI